MVRRQALQSRHDLVDTWVVFHRARTQRIEAQVDGVVPGGETGEMADDFELGDLRETLHVIAVEFITQDFPGMNRRYIEPRPLDARFARRAALEDQLLVARDVRACLTDAVSHRLLPTGAAWSSAL